MDCRACRRFVISDCCSDLCFRRLCTRNNRGRVPSTSIRGGLCSGFVVTSLVRIAFDRRASARGTRVGAGLSNCLGSLRSNGGAFRSICGSCGRMRRRRRRRARSAASSAASARRAARRRRRLGPLSRCTRVLNTRSANCSGSGFSRVGGVTANRIGVVAGRGGTNCVLIIGGSVGTSPCCHRALSVAMHRLLGNSRFGGSVRGLIGTTGTSIDDCTISEFGMGGVGRPSGSWWGSGPPSKNLGGPCGNVANGRLGVH